MFPAGRARLARARPRICFVTPGHLASNPRLVKEAQAAGAAGCRVSIVFAQNLAWLCLADDAILRRHPEWDVRRIDWTDVTFRGRLLRTRSALRQRLARVLFRRLRFRFAAPHALGRVCRELMAVARGIPADLYVAHNLEALPAAMGAARARGARLGFDAEDFHRGQLTQTPGNAVVLQLVRVLEEAYIPKCDYVTAASDGIARAYEAVLGIPRPRTVLNVFPLSDRWGPVPEAALRNEKPAGSRTLYWFSQTIGPGRGLEDAVAALAHLPPDVHLVLRGEWARGYERTLTGLAEQFGVAERLRRHPTVHASELVALTRRHDVGLALETVAEENRELCVANKLFTYVLAGVPCVATATRGQRAICALMPGATRLVPPGDPGAIARAALDLLGAGERARRAATEAADRRFNWETEQREFLEVVERTLRPRAGGDDDCVVAPRA